MLNIGFIFPSSEYLFDPFKGDPHTHFQILTVLESHFGNKHNLTLIDLRGIKKEFALYHIPECDVYLHSVYTLDYNEQLSIVKNLRDRYPKAKHIAGGPHVNVFQEECLKTFDALILGDGDETIIRVITDIMNLKLKKIYRHEGVPVNINKYHYPWRKYLPESAVAKRGLMALKNRKGLEKLLSTTVLFSRGCMHSCSFCSMPHIKVDNLGVRFRTPELIESEIEYLKRDYYMEGINLLDEIGIPVSRNKAIPHLEAIGRTGIVWRGQCRVDGITPETAEMARESGCIALGMGVESVSQRSLDMINKKMKVERAREAISLLKKNGIEARVYMIIGLPGEPEDIVEQTWSFIKETGPELVYLSLFAVRPGTDVYENPERYGIKSINKDWDNTMHLFNRFDDEMPKLTFEYKEQAPWGKGFNSERIINNFLELQSRIKELNLNTQYEDTEKS